MGRRARERRVDNTRELWRRQRRYLAACLFFTTVFLVFAAGMTSELAEGYVWSAGELVADLVTLAASPVVACVTGRHARRLERRAVANPVPEDWLPPALDEDRPGGFDPDEQTARLRGLVSRAAFVGLASTALLGVGGSIATVGDAAAERLLKTGTRVAGTVLTTDEDDYPSFRVRYPVPEGERVTEIRWDTDHRYTPGVRVTVIYEPADSGHTRTVEEPNENQIFGALGISLGIAAGAGVLMSLLAALAWQRRYRSVRETGWRSAEATVSHTLDGGLPSILVRYADDSRIELKSALSLNDAWRMAGPPRQAWVGGTDERMVVLYSRGRWRMKPYAVPARGRKARAPGRRR